MLRCPLCLQSLPDGSYMIRYCRRHPDATATFQISLDDFTGIFCPESGGSCAPSPDIENGVFLFHVGCPCKSAFLAPGTNTIDVANRKKLGGTGAPVEHWQTTVAEEIGQKHNRPEMWFPQALFRAVNERDADALQGCLVLLAGARSVGKTVLSLMAMNPLAYPVTRPVQHFAHITSASASNDDLLQVLEALNYFQTGAAQQPSLMPTHAADVANVKSIFVSRSSLSSRAQRVAGNVGVSQMVRTVLDRLLRTRVSALVTPGSHTAVAFYDTSGELWQTAGGARLFRLRAEADVNAIVMDLSACRCFGSTPPAGNSGWVAREQLEKAQTGGQLRCLVVTKLDVAIATRAAPAGLDLAAMAESIRQGRPPAPSAREVLRTCLAESQDQRERRLSSLIDRDTALPIFFVWTEGLPPGSLSPIQSFGLEPFIDWCLATTVAGVATNA